MKYVFAFLVFLLPLSAHAVMLGDCDSKEYDVIIRNGDAQRVAHIGPHTGEIEEFGPVVSFQMKTADPEDQARELIMKASNPSEEFCIWSGQIKVQRLDTTGEANSGGVTR